MVKARSKKPLIAVIAALCIIVVLLEIIGSVLYHTFLYYNGPYPRHIVWNKEPLETDVFIDYPDSVVIHLDGKVRFLTRAQIDELYDFVMDFIMYRKRIPSAIKSLMSEDFIRKYRQRYSSYSLEFRYNQRRRYVGDISYFNGDEYDAILLLDGCMPAQYLNGRYKRGGSVILLEANVEEYGSGALEKFLRELCF